MASKSKIEELVIPPKLSVFEDKKSKARTIALPFDFPDGSQGIVMVCRLKSEAWVPAKDIEKLVINFT